MKSLSLVLRRLLPVRLSLAMGLCLSLPVAADFNALLGCTSRIVYNRQGSASDVKTLADLVEKASLGELENSEGRDLSGECLQMEKLLKSQSSHNALDYQIVIANLGLKPGVQHLFNGFVKPTYSCSSIGGYLGAYLFGGITGVLDFAQCTSTLGSRWVELRPGLDMGLVFGADIHAGRSYGTDTDVNYSWWPISATWRMTAEMGTIVGVRLINRGMQGIAPNVYGAGLSFGGKVGGSTGLQVNITLFPLWPDYEHLKKTSGQTGRRITRYSVDFSLVHWGICPNVFNTFCSIHLDFLLSCSAYGSVVSQ